VMKTCTEQPQTDVGMDVSQFAPFAGAQSGRVTRVVRSGSTSPIAANAVLALNIKGASELCR